MSIQFGSFTESIATIGLLYMAESNPFMKEAYKTAMAALAEEQRKAMAELERHCAPIDLTPDMEVK